jgi:hypothetical protein
LERLQKRQQEVDVLPVHSATTFSKLTRTMNVKELEEFCEKSAEEKSKVCR